MNKKTLYWVIGIVVIIIIVVVISMSSNNKGSVGASSSSTPSTTSVSPNQTAAGALRQSMHDLIASGATQACTFSIPANATSSSMSGTVYMASSNMRGDFVITSAANKVTNAHMIIASGTVYLWSDALGKGVKLPWSIAASSTALLNRAGGINFDQPATYLCNSWTPDQTEFTQPSTIQFTDISAYMKFGNSGKTIR